MRPSAIAERVAVIFGGALALACLAWTIAQITARPPDYGEGCVLFNAARIRSGLPLYVDPALGAHEYGAPPSRFFVPYTPVYAALLALVPAQLAMSVGRIASAVAWFGSLAVHAAITPRRSRLPVLLASLFVAGIFLFARWSACARPDAFALLLSGVALARAIGKGRGDALSGALFGAAWVLKPSVVGIGIGVIAASLFMGGRRRFDPLVAAVAVVASALGAMMVLSEGAAIRHLRAALGLAFDGKLLVENASSRLLFVLGLIVLAALASHRARSPSGRIALAAIVASTVIATLGLGKLGSTINYLMEPSLASVVVLSRLPLAIPRSNVARLFVVGLVLLTIGWSGVATVRSLLHERKSLDDEAKAIAEARVRCLDRPSAIVMATDPGIELSMNGRIYTHPLELWEESRRGRFSAAIWAEDVKSPNVRCVVTWVGDEAAPPVPAGTFPPAVTRSMSERFVLDGVHYGYAIYRARD